ncbi:serine hydroxymethyltransferase-like [Stegodyphus dumicola]|uniref:serine hydroxymethyltransferase-like n=1 Tax=Stegodyphus dumicola TaxID=202533 RepID=UPI0015A9B075|nr:serine hydroxymethyltransferase-like [Stegodyphus dumicola]
MGLSLDSGGHLTHGHFLSFSGHFYKPVFYHLNQDGLLDYQEIEQIALREKPKAIICGYSAYSKTIDFKKFREIADKVGAYLIADIAHIAGLIATNNYPTPVGYAHIITSTTHKTLRGPRGGIIMTNDDELAPKIDKAVFPGQQGGPLMHIIAAKAQAFGEVLTDQFKTYCSQIIKNAKAFAKVFIDNDVEKQKVDQAPGFLIIFAEGVVNFIDNLYDEATESKLRIVATIHTSYKLSDKQIKDIEAKLKKDYNCTIEIVEKIDDSLLGGIKIFIDNQIIDYSVNKQLEDIKDYLIKEFDE